ncbi:LysR substrate-binding domain-containing protein [Herbaspirillum chlorophenolicum]|uniref:LysR substrate-binding domain-containing protein n=1 Tax=Herbaspirillum chlorophenolicum TaxID=211589 RepID=UPI00067BF6AD|nr:LysR substrate-binding domain-containing protein [Herbaspirillum chlorophenolicum]
MRRKIPGTSMLEAFESAARHLSFTRAAEELSYTEGAISRKIAMLEDYLGVKLFSRVKKRLLLTEAGSNYSLTVRATLDRLEMETTLAMAHDDGRVALELAVLPTFGLKWLMPRLEQFRLQHPLITLNVTAREDPFLFSEESFDAAIHFDHPVWTNAISTYLFTEELVPVCSPALIGALQCARPMDLLSHVLLHKSGRPEAWSRWFELAGVADVRTLKGPRYNMHAMLIEAARAGAGIALVPRTYVADEIAGGQLTIPWEMRVPGAKDYYFIVPENKHGNPGVQALRDWLRAVSEQYRKEHDGS